MLYPVMERRLGAKGKEAREHSVEEHSKIEGDLVRALEMRKVGARRFGGSQRQEVVVGWGRRMVQGRGWAHGSRRIRGLAVTSRTWPGWLGPALRCPSVRRMPCTPAHALPTAVPARLQEGGKELAGTIKEVRGAA